MQTDITLWVVSDGRKGHENQSLGLAEALARHRPASVVLKRVRPARWIRLLPAGVTWRLARLGDGFALAEGAEALAPPWPAAAIGAGRRVAPILAMLKRRHGVAAVQILDPHIPARAFDAMVVPEHDGLPRARAADNVVTSIGAPNRLTTLAIAEAGACLAERLTRLRRPRLAVLIGGPSRSARFTASDGAELLATLERLGRSHGLIVTGSPRTPPELMERLHASLPDAFLWDGMGENPYPGLLAHADAVLVTEDSVSMASEAASTGLPVHVYPLSQVAPKIARFHESLRARGTSRRFTGAIATWEYSPLAEADRIAGELLGRGVV